MTTDDCPHCATMRLNLFNALSDGDPVKIRLMQKLYDQHRAQHRDERKSQNRINQLWPNAKVRG